MTYQYVPCDLQATVSEAILDYGAILFQQRIILSNTPVGTSRVVFSAQDFGNFLAHPLMQAAAKEAVQVSRSCFLHGLPPVSQVCCVLEGCDNAVGAVNLRVSYWEQMSSVER